MEFFFFVIRQIMKMYNTYIDLYIIFEDFKQACYSIISVKWTVLRNFGIPENLIKIIEIYNTVKSRSKGSFQHNLRCFSDIELNWNFNVIKSRNGNIHRLISEGGYSFFCDDKMWITVELEELSCFPSASINLMIASNVLSPLYSMA